MTNSDFFHNTTADSTENAILVHQYESSSLRGSGGDVDELDALARSAGADIANILESVRVSPNASTYIGSGKVAELADMVGESAASLVIVNHAISPIQERNLERAVHCRVIDRTRLILDIFAQRATSSEGKLQVELAQLRHLSTRLVRGWTHLERQKGGIGLRGPGETQLETDRRLLGKRIKTLTRRLEKVRAQRHLRRRARHRVPIPTVSLVGYTNAGKSTLFNALTNAGVLAEDRLFATLDPTMRRLDLPGYGPVVLSDTVGFIRGLPHGLVEAFHSTLEEVSGSGVLLLVVDAADEDRDEQMSQVNAVLEEIGAGDVPTIVVHNKIDLNGQKPGAVRTDEQSPTRVAVSAVTGQGLDALYASLAAVLGRGRRTRVLRLPPCESRLRALMHDRFEVSSERVTEEGAFILELSADEMDYGKINAMDGFNPEFWLEE